MTRAYARTSVSPSSLTRSSLTRPPRSPQTLAAVSTRYTYTSNLAWPGIEAAADFREVPRSQASGAVRPARDLLDLEGHHSSLTSPVSGSDLSILLFRSPFGIVGPRLGDDQCPENRARSAGTKRMTLARIARISVVLVLPLLLLLLVDGSWAQAYPREIKPGERYGDGSMFLTH